MKTLDATDMRIVQKLRENGRRPYAAIAKDLGLSEATVRQRAAKLLEEKTIYITVATNPLELGYLTATVGLKVDGGRHEEVAARLADMPEVDWVAHTAGIFDIAVGLLCRDREQFFDVLVHRIRSMDAVRETQAYLHLSVVKNLYGW
jgi:Lrp/AsnC family transcriptional regulator for asnA, asnC and gidA